MKGDYWWEPQQANPKKDASHKHLSMNYQCNCTEKIQKNKIELNLYFETKENISCGSFCKISFCSVFLLMFLKIRNKLMI